MSKTKSLPTTVALGAARGGLEIRQFMRQRDKRHKGLILLSPPLRFSTEEDLQWWSNDGRPVIALVPEHDDYLKPEEATKRFSALKQIAIIPVEDAKHLWVGEPAVYRVLSEITKVIAPQRLPLPEEF